MRQQELHYKVLNLHMTAQYWNRLVIALLDSTGKSFEILLGIVMPW